MWTFHIYIHSVVLQAVASQVGAIPTAQTARGFWNILRMFFMKHPQKSFETFSKNPNDRNDALKCWINCDFSRSSLLQNIKKIERGTFGDMEKFSGKNEKWEFGFFTFCSKISKNLKGILWFNQKIFKKKFRSGDPLHVSEVLDADFVLEDVLTCPIFFGHP